MQTFLPPLSPSKELTYIQAASNGDLHARSLLIQHNLRLVAHIVRKYANSEQDMEDLISTGTIGLIKAIDTYKTSKGNRLGTYASRCIENELLMLMRQQKKCGKEISLYESMGCDREGRDIQLIDILEAPTVDMTKAIIHEELTINLYHALLSLLSPKELRLIALRYGLWGYEARTQKEVAKLMGISRSYVSRIEKHVLQKLRAWFEDT